MIEGFWQWFARQIARPRVASWIIRRAQRTPFFHLGDYMHRWWLMPRFMLVRRADGVYDRKPWVPIAIRVHHIRRPDADPYLHDHPWPWRTFILRGHYAEEDVFGTLWMRFQGDTRAANAEVFHRIQSVSTGGVWTLFVMGRKCNSWGFMVGTNPPRKVYYREYISNNGRPVIVDE